MADILPAFPLSLVAFPGEELNLHIFEPRYKQLIHECDKMGKTFTILPHYDGKKIRHATEMELVEIARTYDDGKMDIRTKGIGLVKVIDFYDRHPNKLYPGVEIEKLEWDDVSDIVMNTKILQQISILYETMNISNVKILPPDKFRTYQIAHKVGFNVDQELHFLTLTKEIDRQLYMFDHLTKLIPVVEEMEQLRKRAEMNGHFKNVIPRK
ncbi:MAG: LON peptidase substrate-binding domain-containing protein [Bacteroidota bacterium]